MVGLILIGLICMSSMRHTRKCQSSYFKRLVFFALLRTRQSMYVRALCVCVCVYSDSCCAVELLWGGWSSRPARPPFPTFSLLAWTRGLHTHTALIRDKASGREPKSSVVSCLTFPAGEHARWRIGVCSFPSSSQTSTQPRAENREALDVGRGTFFQFKTC